MNVYIAFIISCFSRNSLLLFAR